VSVSGVQAQPGIFAASLYGKGNVRSDSFNDSQSYVLSTFGCRDEASH